MKKLISLTLLVSNAIATPVILQVGYKNITVGGKIVKVNTITQPDGTWGYYAKSGESFNVIVKNKLDQPTVIHWHGLILPNSQDGTELTQELIEPNKEYSYNFKLANTGTFWMHSHYGLQLQDMAVAPLIIEDSTDSKYQQVVIMFQDYTEKPAHEVLTQLQSATHSMHDMSEHDMSNMQMDLNDVDYDAYLTNYHDNSSPQITQVKPLGKVKLRFINSASASNFWINLGKLEGKMIAVDGSPIKPVIGKKFQLAMGQRADIIVEIPRSGGNYPILGQVEGLTKQTGIILSTKRNLNKSKIANNTQKPLPPLDYKQELKIHSAESQLFAIPDRVYKFELTGNMDKYEWKINNQMWPNVDPIQIKKNETVEFEFDNQTMMSHPMHLHGYNFKIVSIDGKSINGAMRDTILVMPHSKVKVAFISDKDGKWMLHCHTLYHMHAGMMTYIEVF